MNEKIFKIKWSGENGFNESAVWHALDYVYGNDDDEIIVEELPANSPEQPIEADRGLEGGPCSECGDYVGPGEWHICPTA